MVLSQYNGYRPTQEAFSCLISSVNDFPVRSRRLRSRGRLTEDNIRESLREVRVALLEADVALPVVKDFIARVGDRAVGQEVSKALKPGQALVKIVHEELKHVLGDESSPLALERQAPVVILLAGLQGAGKTTTAGKLARHIQERQGKKVMLSSCDVYRPAAIDQLETLAQQVEAGFFRSTKPPTRFASPMTRSTGRASSSPTC